MSSGWHIWLVTDVYPPDCGGSGWSTHALATTLIENGNRVEVIGIDPGSTVLTQRLYEGVPVSELGVGAARRSPRRRLGARDYAYKALYDYLAERLVDEPEVDILHAQHLHSGPPSLAVARRFDRGAVLTLRDYWPVCLHGTSWWGGDVCPGCTTERLVGCMGEYWGWPRAAARLMVRWADRRLAARRAAISRAHKVVAVSEALRGRVEADLSGVSFAVVPNIVDAAASEAAAAAAEESAASLMPEGIAGPFLLTAGKLEPTKGFDLLLDALADAGTPWPLLVAGAGSARSALERASRPSRVPGALPGLGRACRVVEPTARGACAHAAERLERAVVAVAARVDGARNTSGGLGSGRQPGKYWRPTAAAG